SAGPGNHLFPGRRGIQVTTRIHFQTEEVAGSRLATSAQPPRATSPLFPSRFAPTGVTAHPSVLALRYPWRASGGPPLHNGFPPAPKNSSVPGQHGIELPTHL